MSMSLKNSVNLLGRQVKNLKNKSKLPVTADNPGLAKPEMLSFFNPITKPEQTDIFTLEPGFYHIFNPKNVPDNIGSPGVWFIRIWETEGDRTYLAQLVAANRFFKFNQHKTGSQLMPSEWQEVKGEVTLWSGAIYKKGTKINLVDSLDKFGKIEVSTMFFGNVEKHVVYEVSSGGQGNDVIPRVISIALKPNTNNETPDNNYLDFFEFKLEVSSDKKSLTLTTVNPHQVNLDAMKATNNDDGDNFRITAITGVR